MISSCKTEYIPVESVRHDSIFFASLQKDSIFIRDSIYIKEYGDTVFKFRNKYIYRFVKSVDTCYIERVDSVRIPYPVERRLSWWQQKKLDAFNFLVYLIIIYVAYQLVRWFIKRTEKK